MTTISKRLGHSKTSTTLDFYAHSFEELDRKESDAIEEMARAIGLSYRRIREVFEAGYEMSLARYILTHRLSNAASGGIGRPII